ncbi:hypothetical protein QBC38DRAFT_490831 [Podospora fimiseda]|uniref:Uncharacterized protein n=1 Tax=Podospora fimiseda TaxID=252190 RepID=A0AAN6YML3_9PEZI|nr:hypothetical protein QBC38DRAFT_490831 [Podospora fimiseda]
MSGTGNDAKVIGLINEWVVKNIVPLARAYLHKGGWENWAQVNLALYLQDHAHEKFGMYPEHTTVQREVNVYQNKDRADLVFGFAPTSQEFVIELKCESWHNGQNFGKEVVKDFNKVTEGQLKTLFKDAAVYSVAISVSAEGIAELAKKPALATTYHSNMDKPIMGEVHQDVDWAGVVVWWFRRK